MWSMCFLAIFVVNFYVWYERERNRKRGRPKIDHCRRLCSTFRHIIRSIIVNCLSLCLGRQKVTWTGNKNNLDGDSFGGASEKPLNWTVGVEVVAEAVPVAKLWNAITNRSISAKPEIDAHNGLWPDPIVIWKPNYRLCPWAKLELQLEVAVERKVELQLCRVTLLSVIDCGLIIKRLLLNWIPYAKPHHG